MPTPIAPGVVRAQAIFQGKSGLPEDRFISTFHFRTPSGTAEALHHAEAKESVRGFYLDPAGAVGTEVPLVNHLSPAVKRGPGALEIRTYHLGDPEPREPVITTHEILGAGSTSALPAEVAVCASFSGDRALPRQRGRIYFGPLSSGVTTLETATGRLRVSNVLMEGLTAAMLRMATTDDLDPARWVVYSPTSNTSTIITKGFVDDSFDTQRRRGEEAVNRYTWARDAA